MHSPEKIEEEEGGKQARKRKNVRCSMMIEMVGSSDTEMLLDETQTLVVDIFHYLYSLLTLVRVELKFIFSSEAGREERRARELVGAEKRVKLSSRRLRTLCSSSLGRSMHAHSAFLNVFTFYYSLHSSVCICYMWNI